MKKTKFWITKVLLSFIFMCSVQTLYAYRFEVDGIYYERNPDNPDETVAVTYKEWNGGGYSGSVHIPMEIEYQGTKYMVTSIGKNAFSRCKDLISVDIPNSVTIINGYAFELCSNLTEIIIPNSITVIGEWAFYNCSGLTSITIPESVISIGDFAFDGCI